MRNELDRATTPPLQEIYREPGHSCFAYGNVVIVYSADEPDGAYMERNALAMARLGAQYPAGLGAIVMIPETARPPSEASRSAIRAGYSAIKRYVRGVVLVIEGEGFAASAKRSVATLLGLAAPLPIPVKITGTTSDASVQLVKLLGSALDPHLTVQLLAAATIEARRSAGSA